MSKSAIQLAGFEFKRIFLQYEIIESGQRFQSKPVHRTGREGGTVRTDEISTADPGKQLVKP